MVDKVKEQAYIDYMMRKLPDVKQGKVHKLQKGDSLWGLAKKELNNPKASNQEISEYMLLIAKLNNLDTIDEMNSLKINDKIYLPEQAAAKSALLSKTQPAKKSAAKRQPTDAEASFAGVKDALFNDKTIHVAKAYPQELNLFHVYQYYHDKESGYISNHHPVVSFTLDKNGKFKSASFEGEKNVNTLGYDYNIDKNGTITQRNKFMDNARGKVDAADMNEVKVRLEELSKQAVLSY